MLLVNLNEDDTAYGMKYERLVVVLTKAVQELSAKNDALEARIATLEAA
jgi:cell division protein FtsB